MNLPENYYLWKQQKLVPHIKEKLQQMTTTEIVAAFSNNLEFGTAGMRAMIAPGSNRINEYTIMKATKAFIAYLKTQYSETDLQTRGLIIAHDNRHFSTTFALLTAQVLAKNNILAYLFIDNELKPTPVLSYSIKKLNAIAGIVITASHNPPVYNGYKIYNEHGCQPLPDVTNVIAANMRSIPDDFNLNFTYDHNLIKEVPLAVEEQYRQEIKNLQFYPDQKRNIKIVYSNLHGTARDWVVPLLRSCGYDVTIVKEQAEFDPDFKGVVSPNPEVKATFALAIAYAKKITAALVILNDPDADRIGIAVYHRGDYVCLNGNETAPILLQYLLSHYQQKELLGQNPTLYNTFVTGTLADAVAKSYNCKVVKTYTGFKWIAAAILKGQSKDENCVFAFEEAYGYLIKNINLDKDGIQAAIVLAEACWYYWQKQQTLVTVLDNLYQRFGYHYFYTVNVALTSAEQSHTLAILRKETISELAHIKLVKKVDYAAGFDDMPGQDLLQFYFADGSWFAVRASGTEPKIKFYFVCLDKTHNAAKTKMHAMFQELAHKYLKWERIEALLNEN